MASYQVLAAPQNIGFLTGLGRGLDESAGKYADAMLKRQEDKQKKSEKQANLNKFAEAMKSGGFEPSTATMTADGNPSYSYRRKAAPKPPEDVFAKTPFVLCAKLCFPRRTQLVSVRKWALRNRRNR